MKKLILLALLLASSSLTLSAQGDKATRPSPPATAEKKLADFRLAINYSQPSVKGRTIWGMLVPYGKVWRTGANEATTFEVNKDVLIEGQKLPKGKYSLFTIPGEGEWELIFNSDVNQWGAYNYDKAKNVLDGIKIKPNTTDDFTERMTFAIDKKSDEEAVVTLKWEKLAVNFVVTAAK